MDEAICGKCSANRLTLSSLAAAKLSMSVTAQWFGSDSRP